jgi:transketolase
MGFTDPLRLELEAQWRSRLQVAQQQYYQASAKYRQVVEEHIQRLTPTPDGAFAVSQAAKAEVAARREYMRVLEIFSPLVVHGKMPEVHGKVPEE